MTVEIKKKSKSKSTLVTTKASKEDQAVLASNALNSEDEFEGLYDPSSNDNNKPLILQPPFPPRKLIALTQQNNALLQLISAMEVNIDGTGYDILPEEQNDSDSDDKEKTITSGVMDFFDEIYPGMSFTTVRRNLRRDQEGTGNAYLEVLRSVSGDVVFARQLNTATMRLVRYDDPVTVQMEVKRFGKTKTVSFSRRERRFAQKIGNEVVYFKEFGASRDLDKHTGIWAEKGEILPANDRATEVIHFTVTQDSNSPYGLPRWINQVPSVLGSRKAEELNLEFFNAGGLPPVLITVQGGELTDRVKAQLRSYLSGKGASRHRAAIVEAIGTSGSLDSNSNVRIGVERFGAERQQDSMFEGYDAKCAARIRSSFRLGPLFVGKAEDYSFATAFASYTVAEAQVFEPERQEFDEIINNTIMKQVAPGYQFVSRPLTITDIQHQMKAMELIKDTMSVDEYYRIIGDITNLPLKVPEEYKGKTFGQINVDRVMSTLAQQAQVPGANEPTPTPTPGEAPGDTAAKSDPFTLIELANEWAGYASGNMPLSGLAESSLQQRVKTLKSDERHLFDAYVAMRLMSGYGYDPEGCIEMVSASTDMLCGCGSHAD